MGKNKKGKSGFTTTWIVVIILILLFIFGGFMFWRMFFGFPGSEADKIVEQKLLENQNQKNSATPSQNAQSSKINAALAGTWVSDCLVPDSNSPWSEKHQFVINADGTAVHTRWSSSGHNCSPDTTMIDKYTLTIPAKGQINLSDTEKGAIIYDIYETDGSALYFGHGFRGDKMAYPATFGDSPSKRINTLNRYIVYRKK